MQKRNTPKLQVKEACDLGHLFTKNDVRMIGQDGAYSIPINAEESLWFFGDTFVGTLDANGRRVIENMPSNSGLICHSREVTSGLTDFSYMTNSKGEIRQLIPHLPDEDPERVHIWGMDAVFLENHVYWYYIRVRIVPERQWPYKFDVEGTGLAKAKYPELVFHRVQHDGSSTLWNENAPCFGVAVLHDKKEGLMYIYGSYLKEGYHYCALSRVGEADLCHVSAYEYLVATEPRWSPHLDEAISVMEGMPTEMSVSYNPHLECYLAVHSWETTGRLVGRTAPHPWGPWSEPITLWNSNVGLRNPLAYDGPIVYAGKEHPELSRDNGKIIYLTCVEFEEYFPRLIEVELK